MNSQHPHMALNAAMNAIASGSDEDLVSALASLREAVCDGTERVILDLCRSLVRHHNLDVRWQSLIIISEFIPFGTFDEEIWGVVLFNCGIDDDLQAALATVVLEHLLEHKLDMTLQNIQCTPRDKQAAMADLLRRCWQFGQSEEQWARVLQLIEAFDTD